MNADVDDDVNVRAPVAVRSPLLQPHLGDVGLGGRPAGEPVLGLRCQTVYVTTVPTWPAGRVSGPLVVSVQAVPAGLVARPVEITSRYPAGHSVPMHIGDPAALGTSDLATPDFGPSSVVEPGDVPAFWACGVTPQLALPRLGDEYVITHGLATLRRRVQSLPGNVRFLVLGARSPLVVEYRPTLPG
ncbi:D-glutamate cyclase family protein [Streptomyces olivochromogenes]|uniref:D-glutamate cyclase family protein n=1 Tax=Streptomyces olivochromogenes TaxID=1963 RepID=UPI0036D8B1CD